MEEHIHTKHISLVLELFLIITGKLYFVGIDIRGDRGGAWPYEINFNFQGVLCETA